MTFGDQADSSDQELALCRDAEPGPTLHRILRVEDRSHQIVVREAVDARRSCDSLLSFPAASMTASRKLPFSHRAGVE